MNLTLLHTPEFPITSIAEALAAEKVKCVSIRSAKQLVVGDNPTLFIFDPGSRDRFAGRLQAFADSGGGIVAIGDEGERDIPAVLDEELLTTFVPQPCGTRQLLLALRTSYRTAVARLEADGARRETASRTKEIGELTRIGMALATERDYNSLLNLILTQARRLTSSDAASLYLVEHQDDGDDMLRFKLSQTYSRPDIPLVEFTIPINKSSIAGYVATTGEPLVIDDAYFLPPDSEYEINRSVDSKYNYRTKSILTIPMTDHKGEVIGVLQLINRKRDYEAKLNDESDFDAQVIPYTRRLVELVSALAGQAAVSIENSQLYEDIERLFEGFVRASVTAIEQRDPTTFGHSGRVADMTVGLATVVDRATSGPYAATSFSREEIRELRYAGLLHDFGKVGVREQVLVKAKKLYPPDLALLKQRYSFIRRTADGEFYRKRMEFLEKSGRQGYDEFLEKLSAEHERELAELDHFIKLVVESNEPTVLPEGSFEELLEYANRFYLDLDGQEQPYLAEDEVRFLSIRKGSLDDAERLEIESHVTHTYRFLQQIPWTKELSSIPKIALGHHEKLNGTGYPGRITASEIPVQTRMMTISDIFDALTASDRPYKRAVPLDRALDILSYEVNDGMLDSDLFELFVEGKVFETSSGD
ncbi:MAG: HD domain-containing phosphohydrolase [Gemmatimonadales bacterium]